MSKTVVHTVTMWSVVNHGAEMAPKHLHFCPVAILYFVQKRAHMTAYDQWRLWCCKSTLLSFSTWCVRVKTCLHLYSNGAHSKINKIHEWYVISRQKCDPTGSGEAKELKTSHRGDQFQQLIGSICCVVSRAQFKQKGWISVYISNFSDVNNVSKCWAAWRCLNFDLISKLQCSAVHKWMNEWTCYIQIKRFFICVITHLPSRWYHWVQLLHNKKWMGEN